MDLLIRLRPLGELRLLLLNRLLLQNLLLLFLKVQLHLVVLQLSLLLLNMLLAATAFWCAAAGSGLDLLSVCSAFPGGEHM